MNELNKLKALVLKTNEIQSAFFSLSQATTESLFDSEALLKQTKKVSELSQMVKSIDFALGQQIKLLSGMSDVGVEISGSNSFVEYNEKALEILKVGITDVQAEMRRLRLKVKNGCDTKKELEENEFSKETNIINNLDINEVKKLDLVDEIEKELSRVKLLANCYFSKGFDKGYFSKMWLLRKLNLDCVVGDDETGLDRDEIKSETIAWYMYENKESNGELRLLCSKRIKYRCETDNLHKFDILTLNLNLTLTLSILEKKSNTLSVVKSFESYLKTLSSKIEISFNTIVSSKIEDTNNKINYKLDSIDNIPNTELIFKIKSLFYFNKIQVPSSTTKSSNNALNLIANHIANKLFKSYKKFILKSNCESELTLKFN